MSTIAIVAVSVLAFVLWLGVVPLALYFVQMKRVPHPPPFEQKGDGVGPRILILGESIALGYGVKNAMDGFAGLIGKAFPNASIKVVALPFRGTRQLYQLFPVGGDYDVIVLTTSGNDFLTISQTELKSSLEKMLQICRNISKSVVVLGNFDNLCRGRYFYGTWWFEPVPLIVHKLLQAQGRVVRRTYRQALDSARLPGSLVEAHIPMDSGTTAGDGVHPNERGHEAFAEPIIKKLKELLA